MILKVIELLTNERRKGWSENSDSISVLCFSFSYCPLRSTTQQTTIIMRMPNSPNFHKKPDFKRQTPLILRCIILENSNLSPQWPSHRIQRLTPVSGEFTVAVHHTASVSCLARKIIELDLDALSYLDGSSLRHEADLVLWGAMRGVGFEDLDRLNLDLNLYSGGREDDSYIGPTTVRGRRVALLEQCKPVGEYFIPQFDARSTRNIHLFLRTYPRPASLPRPPTLAAAKIAFSTPTTLSDEMRPENVNTWKWIAQVSALRRSRTGTRWTERRTGFTTAPSDDHNEDSENDAEFLGPTTHWPPPDQELHGSDGESVGMDAPGQDEAE